MGYRKKAMKLEIRRGENVGFVVQVEGNQYPVSPEKNLAIIEAIGENTLNDYLRPTKIQKAPEEPKPTEPIPPAPE